VDLKDLANDELRERKPPADVEVMGVGEDSALPDDVLRNKKISINVN